MSNISIAIDGPAGAGKSTIAKIIAKTMNLTYIDTGAMYRAITLKVIREKIDTENLIELADLLKRVKINLVEEKIFLNEELVNEEIRSPEVNQLVSTVAKIAIVRQKMVEWQREIASEKNVIMDGRDIGTHVLPNAIYKFFLTASIEERAKRRFEELNQTGFHQTLEEVKMDICKRDKIDSEREISPLKMADDAILIDTTGINIFEVVDKILSYVKY